MENLGVFGAGVKSNNLPVSWLSSLDKIARKPVSMGGSGALVKPPDCRLHTGSRKNCKTRRYELPMAVGGSGGELLWVGEHQEHFSWVFWAARIARKTGPWELGLRRVVVDEDRYIFCAVRHRFLSRVGSISAAIEDICHEPRLLGFVSES
ncbi:uncharacterized protein BDZ99DRAFT_266578 [Mytilinidion resinicola]|uniref:Uncharacterized protein n=1 Tax=Mytilinidion resinicola TaxID=574789 RepID=A0A6A6YX15_9PEZI|nr:uncharacterized protein BDZ99DRAFT_266578 [Mytilinidion resinicola]KAF2812447.1 hypothetical protein BDZ99DRAFT_266578 [Mytilinidion resinicola]